MRRCSRGFRPETCAIDSGYDVGPIYDAFEALDCRPIIKLRRLHPLIPRETLRWGKLYARRALVEQEFGRLKNEWALLPLRVRGIDRVQLHADLTILAKLACARAWARAVPLAA